MPQILGETSSKWRGFYHDRSYKAVVSLPLAAVAAAAGEPQLQQAGGPTGGPAAAERWAERFKFVNFNQLYKLDRSRCPPTHIPTYPPEHPARLRI